MIKHSLPGWRRLAAFLCVFTVLATTSACGDSSTDPAGGIEGTYILQSVNGQSLPATLFQLTIGDVTFEERLVAGQITLTSSTYSGSLTTQSRENGVVVDSEVDNFGGTYTRSGNTLTLRDSDGDEDVIVTIAGNRLTAALNADGISFTLVFAK